MPRGAQEASVDSPGAQHGAHFAPTPSAAADRSVDFYESFPHLIKRLCREDNQDNTFLYKMLDSLEQVNAGEKSMANVELSLGNELANKFLYPALEKK